MSVAALSVDRAAARRGRPWALLRGPVPVWTAPFVRVQAFLGLPTAVPIPGTIGQLIIQDRATPVSTQEIGARSSRARTGCFRVPRIRPASIKSGWHASLDMEAIPS
jgi:hypothetical protein